ncbi:hypothetical protein EV714DRAFT_221840, partial [Schizophyllum commune]
MLPAASSIPLGAKDCMAGTRLELLKAIDDWVVDASSTRCLLLTGMAGEGKSSVAHAIARQLKDTAMPTLFFAFNRSDPSCKARQVIPTLALQLSCSHATYLQHLRTLTDYELKSRHITTQYNSLLAPFLRAHMSLIPIVFIIDALDECPDTEEEAEDRHTLLNTLQAILNDNFLHNVRIFITARPDKDI